MLALQSMLGVAATSPSAASSAALSSSAARRRQLRALEEIVGTADPSRWVDEFRSLLLIRDARTTYSKHTDDHERHFRLSSAELVDYYRYEWGGGYMERQIAGMVSIGWDEQDAIAVRMLTKFGSEAISGALRLSDKTFASSCHAVRDALVRRAQSCAEVAPTLYMPMQAWPALGLFGLSDRDPAAALLGRRTSSSSWDLRETHGFETNRMLYSAPLIIGDDPTLVTARGCWTYDGKGDCYRPCRGDMVALRSDENSVSRGEMRTAVLTVKNSQVPRWALPPHVMLTLESITQPPFDATFRRWHQYSEEGVHYFVDRREPADTGKKLVPLMYKKLADGRFRCTITRAWGRTPAGRRGRVLDRLRRRPRRALLGDGPRMPADHGASCTCCPRRRLRVSRASTVELIGRAAGVLQEHSLRAAGTAAGSLGGGREGPEARAGREHAELLVTRGLHARRRRPRPRPHARHQSRVGEARRALVGALEWAADQRRAGWARQGQGARTTSSQARRKQRWQDARGLLEQINREIERRFRFASTGTLGTASATAPEPRRCWRRLALRRRLPVQGRLTVTRSRRGRHARQSSASSAQSAAHTPRRRRRSRRRSRRLPGFRRRLRAAAAEPVGLTCRRTSRRRPPRSQAVRSAMAKLTKKEVIVCGCTRALGTCP